LSVWKWQRNLFPRTAKGVGRTVMRAYPAKWDSDGTEEGKKKLSSKRGIEDDGGADGKQREQQEKPSLRHHRVLLTCSRDRIKELCRGRRDSS
jgi:hypothetical protein